MSSTATSLLGVECRKIRPTVRHRPAVWEAMLGTVYAMNDEGTVRYFDYDWDSALSYAGVAPDRDPRVWRVGITSDGNLRANARRQHVLFITRTPTT